MRHRVRKGRKLSRNQGQRRSLWRSLLVSLVVHEELTTTVAKGKELKTRFDKLVTLARRARAGNFSLQRKIGSLLSDKKVVVKLFEQILPRLGTRPSGFLRLQRTGQFREDGAEKVRLQIIKEAVSDEKSERHEKPKKVASPRGRQSAPRASRRQNQ